MSLSLGELGKVSAELMELLEEEHAQSEDVTIGVVAVVAEVNYVDEDGDEVTEIRYRCSDGKRWIQSALFTRCQRIADLEMSD